MTTALVAVAIGQYTHSRFLSLAPFTSLGPINVDRRYCQGSFTDEACRKFKLQGRVIWIDGTANLTALSSTEKVKRIVHKIATLGFNSLVLDVKPIVGRTLYPSQLTDQMTAWKGQSIPAGFDPVKAVSEAARAEGLSFMVSLNAFSEGHSYAKRDESKPDSQFGDAGWGYRHPELQSVLYTLNADGTPAFKPSSEGQTQIPLMMSPHHPEIQARVLSFVTEVASRYHPDVLLFDDRFRFHSLNADFSELARARFESKVGRELDWPGAVFTLTRTPEGQTGIRPGPYFDDWLAWRAEELASFVGRVRATLSKASPTTKFGIYAGSWYGDYAKYGSNYASNALTAGFPFLTRLYQQTGFASKLDLLITGCYYKTASMFEAMEQAKPIGQTVEAAGDVTNRVARDQCWTYAGIQLADFQGDNKKLARALQAAAATTQGVMVFDLSHNIDAYAQTLQSAFRTKRDPPHMAMSQLDWARRKRELTDKAGLKERPFPILEGAPGSGF
ncbi:MAG: family 10 glycosylhydrolase [Armatimonadetes bacterium]|nr:family 10 glycosylhydrolase [Armatimonadota bacterium]